MKPVKVISWLAAIFALAVVAGYILFARPLLQFAPLASAYGAKKVCSCVFVAERDLEACKADFTEDVSAATFVLEESAVRVEILGGRYVERAEYRGGLGCTLVPEG